MSLVLHDPSSSSSSSSPAAGKVDAVVGGAAAAAGGGGGPAGATAAALQWDYSPKSMDADGATSNGGTCGAESVIGELNGDCSTDDTASLAQNAIIKQVRTLLTYACEFFLPLWDSTNIVSCCVVFLRDCYSFYCAFIHFTLALFFAAVYYGLLIGGAIKRCFCLPSV